MIKLSLPNNTYAAGQKVLLHTCCAPCSSAILECMLQNEMQPIVYFSNSNIYPLAEYEKRKQELIRHLQTLNVTFIEDDYNHQQWLDFVRGLENEPERGIRCSKCFLFRLSRAAKKANELGIHYLTTTLASSRWKDINQINKAGLLAVSDIEDLLFWEQNWRKGGLQERRNQLLKELGFYNQQYCGCEFSIRTKQN